MNTLRPALALFLCLSMAAPLSAAPLSAAPLSAKTSAIVTSAKTGPAPTTTAKTSSPLQTTGVAAGFVPGAGVISAATATATGGPGSPSVRALHGDLDLFRSWADAEDRALASAIRIKRSATHGVRLADLADAEQRRQAADAAWRDALASYAGAGGDPEAALVFVRLHDRVALRLLTALLRPELTWAGPTVEAESFDPVTARGLAQAFHAAAAGQPQTLNFRVRMLRERLGFAQAGERAQLFSRALAVVDRIDQDLASAGLPAGDAFVGAMLPGLGALVHGDPCAPDALLATSSGGVASSIAPTQEDLDRMARMGMALSDLRGQAEFDCEVASGGAGAGGTGGAMGYGEIADAMACLGGVFGEDEEPTDYGMCMAAGLGASDPLEIGLGQLDGQGDDCGNPLADGSDKKHEPFDFRKWYQEEFVEEEMQKGDPLRPVTEPEDVDEQTRKDINAEFDDTKTFSADIGLIGEIVGAIVDAVKKVVDWVVGLFRSDEPKPEKQDPSAENPDKPDANEDPEPEKETPEPEKKQDGTTLPGPDGVGGGGCVDPLVELAESCIDRVMSQLPGHRGKDDLLRRGPGIVDPWLARPWDGSPGQLAADAASCGGAGTPENSDTCGQLTDPPSACPEPGVSAAAQFFAEQALRDRFCATAYCAPDVPCVCTDGLPEGAPPSPGGGNPGDPVGPEVGGGLGDPYTLNPGVSLGGSAIGSGPALVNGGNTTSPVLGRGELGTTRP